MPEPPAPPPPYPAPPQGYPAQPDPMAERVAKAAEHVRLLGILTWIYAGLQSLGILFGLVYTVIGIVFVINPPSGGSGPNNPPPPDWFGWIFVGIGLFVVLLSSVFVTLSCLSARDLMRHRRRVFCIVVAATHCLNIPLGAVLGIFTIVILSKPEAVRLFEQRKR